MNLKMSFSNSNRIYFLLLKSKWCGKEDNFNLLIWLGLLIWSILESSYDWAENVVLKGQTQWSSYSARDPLQNVLRPFCLFNISSEHSWTQAYLSWCQHIQTSGWHRRGRPRLKRRTKHHHMSLSDSRPRKETDSNVGRPWNFSEMIR